MGLFGDAFLLQPEAPCSSSSPSPSATPKTLTLAHAGPSPAQRKREGAATGPLRSFSLLRLPLLTSAPLPHPAQAQCNEREREGGDHLILWCRRACRGGRRCVGVGLALCCPSKTHRGSIGQLRYTKSLSFFSH